MAVLRFDDKDAIQVHEMMHKLGIHHHAPEMVELYGMITTPGIDSTDFKTRLDPRWVAAKLREYLPGIRVRLKVGWWWEDI